MAQLDMNLNFTMTDLNDSMNPGGYGGMLGDEALGSQNIQSAGLKKKKVKKSKKKDVAGKLEKSFENLLVGKLNEINRYFNIDPKITEKEIKLDNDDIHSAILK